jgi:hypothetical protein
MHSLKNLMRNVLIFVQHFEKVLMLTTNVNKLIYSRGNNIQTFVDFSHVMYFQSIFIVYMTLVLINSILVIAVLSHYRHG